MKKIIILNVILGVVFLCSCKLDNYSLPDMTLDGVVVDKVTGENIQTRQPNGIKIRLMQEGYSNPQPYDFWVKSDGSFRNTRLFAGKYNVIAMEGAFESASVDTVNIDLNQNRTIKFEVEPYARLKNVNISVSAGTITATYNISLTTSTKDLSKSMLLCDIGEILHETTVGVKKSTENNLKVMTDPQIIAKQFTDQITGLTAGTYYARVAILAENTLNRYNYSPIIKLVVP